MITNRDFVVEEHRRHDAMIRAEQHRLVQGILADCNQGPRYWRRCLGRVGELLVALGKRMQTPSISPEPAAVTR